MDDLITILSNGARKTVNKGDYITAKFRDLHVGYLTLTEDAVRQSLDEVLNHKGYTFPVIASFIESDKPMEVT